MTSLCRLAVAALLYPCGPMTPASAQQPDTAGALPAPDRYEPVLDQFRRMTARGDSVAAVRNLSLQRDAIRFQFEDGTLYLATPVDGRTIAAIFVGRGTVAFAPPLEIERREVRRILGDSVVNSRISAAAFVFTDSTLSELRRQAGFHAGGDAGRASGVLHDALDHLVDGQDVLQPTLIATLLNGDGAGSFYAHVKREQGEDLMFSIDPREAEQVSLLRGGREGSKVRNDLDLASFAVVAKEARSRSLRYFRARTS